jgi:hypothetical protein
VHASPLLDAVPVGALDAQIDRFHEHSARMPQDTPYFTPLDNIILVV